VTALECESAMKDVQTGTVTWRSEALTDSGTRVTVVTIDLKGRAPSSFRLTCDRSGLPVEATVEKGEDPLGYHRLLLFLRQPLLKAGSGAGPGRWSVELPNPLTGSRNNLDVDCVLEKIEGDVQRYRLTQKSGLLKLGPTAQAEVTTVLTLNGRDGRVESVVQTSDLFADGMKNQSVVHDERPEG